jgi:7-cyano-7-deazaguanine synthase
MNARAIVLLSGGLDSVTVLALARDAGREVHALSFLYGQRHAVELQSARRQATRMGARAHEVVDLQHLGRLVAPATALVTGAAHDVPKDRTPSPSDGVPITYVPARNTLFLSYALAWAEVLVASEIWIGVNALDYSGYPDCRPDFLAAFERVANLGTRVGRESAEPAIRVQAPLVDLHKHEIIARGTALGVDYADTVSCYDPAAGDDAPLACGRCESCRLRREGFLRAGVLDPTRYVGGAPA